MDKVFKNGVILALLLPLLSFGVMTKVSEKLSGDDDGRLKTEIYNDPQYPVYLDLLDFTLMKRRLSEESQRKALNAIVPKFKEECKKQKLGFFDFKYFHKAHPEKDYEIERKLLFAEIAVELGIIDELPISSNTVNIFHEQNKSSGTTFADKQARIFATDLFCVDLDGPNDDQEVEAELYMDYVFREVEGDTRPRYWYQVELKYRKKGTSEWTTLHKYIDDHKISSGGPYSYGRMFISMQKGTIDLHFTAAAREKLGEKRTYKTNDNSQGITMEMTDNGNIHTRKFKYIGAKEINAHEWDGRMDWE